MAENGSSSEQQVVEQQAPANGQDAEMAPPAKPNPSLDPGVVPKIDMLPEDTDAEVPTDDNFDVSTMQPTVAMQILSRGLQALVTLTGDIPPTPPVSRTPSATSLSGLRPPNATLRPKTPPHSAVPGNDIKRLSFQDTQIGTPEAKLSEPIVVDADARAQHDTLARKFFSKHPPPISVALYLQRLHRYCPMSTAVYLAAAVYIHRLAVEQRTVPVTSRTVHRLVLASLRVAMKALEDLSYPHSRFAGVGGVSERELAKLEVSLCYLTDFELRVDCELLFEKSKAMLELDQCRAKGMKLTLPLRNKADRRKTIA